MVGYESSLLEEVCVDLTQNDVTNFSIIWGEIDEVQKGNFMQNIER